MPRIFDNIEAICFPRWRKHFCVFRTGRLLRRLFQFARLESHRCLDRPMGRRRRSTMPSHRWYAAARSGRTSPGVQPFAGGGRNQPKGGHPLKTPSCRGVPRSTHVWRTHRRGRSRTSPPLRPTQSGQSGGKIISPPHASCQAIPLLSPRPQQSHHWLSRFQQSHTFGPVPSRRIERGRA